WRSPTNSPTPSAAVLRAEVASSRLPATSSRSDSVVPNRSAAFVSSPVLAIIPRRALSVLRKAPIESLKSFGTVIRTSRSSNHQTLKAIRKHSVELDDVERAILGCIEHFVLDGDENLVRPLGVVPRIPYVGCPSPPLTREIASQRA